MRYHMLYLKLIKRNNNKMKKEIELLSLAYGQTDNGLYIAVLSEINGKRKLPIYIKATDAQQIVLKSENIKSTVPSIHDLFKSFTDTYLIDIQEVYIYKMYEGIFYTKLILSNGIDDGVELDCSVGDGIGLSITYDCPLYASEEILEIAGIYVSDDGILINKDDIDDDNIDEEETDEDPIASIDNLTRMLDNAVKNEDYELAVEIRNKINELKNKII